MFDFKVRHDSVGQIFYHFCIIYEGLDGSFPQFNHHLYNLQYFKGNLILLNTLFLFHFENGLCQAFEQSILDEPNAHAIEYLVNLIISWLFWNHLMQKLYTLHIYVRVRVIEDLQYRVKDVWLNYQRDVFLPELLQLLKQAVNRLFRLVEFHWICRVLHS